MCLFHQLGMVIPCVDCWRKSFWVANNEQTLDSRITYLKNFVMAISIKIKRTFSWRWISDNKKQNLHVEDNITAAKVKVFWFSKMKNLPK